MRVVTVHHPNQGRHPAWLASLLALAMTTSTAAQESPELAPEPLWLSPLRARLVIKVEASGIRRSHCPVRLELDLAAALRAAKLRGSPDPQAIEVLAHDALGVPYVADATRRGYERYLLPWRFDALYEASSEASEAMPGTLAFVQPREEQTVFAIYFDTLESGHARSNRYPGLVGDGDFFRELEQKRAVAASHFDTFADLDDDGDLDLFQGGVEPFVYCHENLGNGRLIERGRLANAGKLFVLPHNPGNGRSWVVPHFHDLDGDGDLDFFPSFMDGPHARRIAHFENVTSPGGLFTCIDRGALITESGTPLADGGKAGNWFPSVVFIDGFVVGPEPERPDQVDIILGYTDRCLYHRHAGKDATGSWRWEAPVALRADGEEIVLFNPCFAFADVDGDGDRDLFAAPQSGEILFYQNLGGSSKHDPPRLARSVAVAYNDVYTMPSTHPRVTVADFTGDGLLDLAIDRAWELTDLRSPSSSRDYGALLKNVGTATAPTWSRVSFDQGALHSQSLAICNAARQNVVRAVDWDADDRLDLLAGDCDGFIWFFRNTTGPLAPIFEPGQRLDAGGTTLSLASSGGHARPDVCDWNADGLKDLVVADGSGRVTLFLGKGTKGAPKLDHGRLLAVEEDGKPPQPIQRGTRAHLAVGDWNNDGKKDLFMSDQQNPGYFVFENHGTDAEPRLSPARSLGLSPHVRPNLGSWVDWDQDGKRDLVACEFEHSIRLYRNTGSGEPREAPSFADTAGTPLLKPATIMMISGADVVDWNQDGDLDIITGQGHGGGGLRFYERDFIDNEARGTHPIASIERIESASPDLLHTVRRYADVLMAHGRDVHGPIHSGLFLSALDRTRRQPLKSRPAPPAGIRREDRTGLPWQTLSGSNLQLDQNLLRSLHSLSEVTGDQRYRQAADQAIKWFFDNAQSPVTGLLAWGEHLCWDVFLDRPISSSTELTHEFARPWALWQRSHELAPEACQRFALGLWHHQIANHKTGGFDRHAPFDRHGPRDGKDFARHAGFYIDTWAHAYAHSRNPLLLEAIEVLLARFERKRGLTSPPQATLGPLDTASAAALVPEPLATRLRKFAEVEDRLILEDLGRQFGQADGGWSFSANWQAGYSSSTSASWAMFALARHEQTGKSEFRDLVVAIADVYFESLPTEDVDVWPMSFAHVIAAQTAAHRFTGNLVYLAEAARLARLATQMFWGTEALPRASLKTGHYETITGADSLALALLDVHVALENSKVVIPSNTIDR